MTRRFPAGDIAVAIAFTLVLHAGMAVALAVFESSAPAHAPREKKVQPRWRHGEVAYERRPLEEECTSIPECQFDPDPVEIKVQVATLGMKAPDPKKLPEIQKFEEPELVEKAVNVEEEPQKLKPKTLQDFKRRKQQLDKKRKRQEKKLRNLFNLNDDPRANPTRLQDKFGLQTGDVGGVGFTQSELDTYYAKLALELHRRFFVPNSLTRQQLRKKKLYVVIQVAPDGSIVKYRLGKGTSHKGFRLAAEAALRSFMPREGGNFRLPSPPQGVEKALRKGVKVLFDGSLFE